jgi:hypothetical protein
VTQDERAPAQSDQNGQRLTWPTGEGDTP